MPGALQKLAAVYVCIYILAYCTIHQFRCHDGTCIPKTHACDGNPDCSEKEDEENCPEFEGEFLTLILNTTVWY